MKIRYNLCNFGVETRGMFFKEYAMTQNVTARFVSWHTLIVVC